MLLNTRRTRDCDYDRLVYKWECFEGLLVRDVNTCMLFFWTKFRMDASERTRVWKRGGAWEREKERERENKGRVLGADWNGWDTCTALKTPIKYPPLTPLTTPPLAAPSHSNYEPRAGRSEYNFLYCVNVRTYVWIRKMFILQKKRKHFHLFIPQSYAVTVIRLHLNKRLVASE